MKQLTAVLILLSGILYACGDDTVKLDTSDLDIVSNSPVITNVSNSYVLSVYGVGFSDTMIAELDFDTTALVLSLQIANHDEGAMQLSILDQDSVVGYSGEFARSIVITETPTFRPAYLRMELDEFSGLIQLTLTVDE